MQSTSTSSVSSFIASNLYSISAFTAWCIYIIAKDRWSVFQEGWPMTITMAFGAFVAGSTPLGSGAVAYPVMVLVLKVLSNNARTFALMIQSVGMGSASYRIIKHHSRTLNMTSILYMIWTGIIGFNIGFYLVRLPGNYVKSIYFSLTLLLGVIAQSYVNTVMPHNRVTDMVLTAKEYAYFFPFAVLGGILISMVGTGLDVVLYIYLRLFHNTDELVTTNHTIIVQSFITMFGFYNALVIDKDIPPLIWKYWLSSIPAVVITAPLGNYVINRWANHSRLNKYFYALEIFQYVAGFVITISKATNTIIISSAIVGSGGIALAMRYVLIDRNRRKKLSQYITPT